MPTDVVPKALRVPEGLPELLRDLIHDRTGIFFEDSRMDLLLAKLEPLARDRECASFLEYYYALKDNDRGEWDRAWEALSVQETYFWREIAQINALVDNIIPEWFQKTSLPFRIWSAACATGEEPYTIAIALAEKGLGSHPIEIFASDASPAAVEKAQRGIYREKSFRVLSPALRQKYFAPVAGGSQLSPEIMERVKFSRVNLLELGEVSPVARVQALFCRNAFIYFSRHSIRQTVAMMAAKMPPGAHLFVGASESLLRLTTDFDLKEIEGALVYVRV
ncbi:MAG TPA: protein-glutamate O-methyltransferase CheR [Verrucomicrobiae bacterium]|jgi:chemotaxis protein methyltransferase CheR|nr:protein-glutamate O-methyltransferase CheR [Verrucomicrobiae bacterium]